MKKTKKAIHRWLSLLLTAALVITMLPVVPGSVEAKAENATVLYIKDAPGAETKTVTEDMSVSANGWSWEQETATLTLDGFDGEYIEAGGDINIVLTGDNMITLPAAPDASSVCGIKSSGAINITGDGEGEEDTLTVTQTGFTRGDVYVTGINAETDLTITDCKVAVNFSAADSGNEIGYYSRVGLAGSSGSTYVTGCASLDIDITENNYSATGVLRGLYAQTSGTVDINIYDADGADGTANGDFIGVGGLIASGNGTIHLSVPNGNAIEGPLVVNQTTGDITFEGGIKVGSTQGSYMESKNRLYLAPNKKITVTADENAKSGIMHTNFNGTASQGCYLIKEDGTKVTGGNIVTQENNPLVFADSAELDISGLVVGGGYSGKYFHGMVFGGSGEYTFSIDPETPLPAGLELRQRNDYYYNAYIAGTATEECEAGSFNIIVTDSASHTASITVNYDAILDPPKAICVDETEFTTAEDQSGTTWNYEASTKTLTLNGYDGGLICSEEDLNIILKGDNTLTLPAAPDASSVCGIKSSGAINITGDDEGEEDTLTVTQTGFTRGDVYVTGIDADTNLTITDCKVAVNFSAADSGNEIGYYQRVGLVGRSGSTYVTGCASLDIDITENNYSVTGVLRGLYAQTSGTVDINIYDADEADGTAEGDFIGVGGLIASGNGTIHLSTPNGNAIEGPLVVNQMTGDITFEGGIKVGSTQGSYMESKNGLYLAPNKKITVTADENAKSGIMHTNFNGTASQGCYLIKEDGTKVTGGNIVTQENNPLVFADSAELDISGLVVGGGYSGKYFHGMVFGGSGEYTFSIDPETPLPAGLELRQRNDYYYNAYIGGTVTEECEAGSFNIIVTDSSSNTASITVNYDAISVANPITGISFVQPEIVLDIGEMETLEVVITPDDASDKTLNWSSSDSTVAYFGQNGQIKASSPGTTTVTVTTHQGGLKDTCKVYVKEVTPSATSGETHIEDLIPNANYSVSGNSLTADANGEIEIIDAWRDKTIDIIKLNAEPKCNSDVQQLYIPDKSAVSIMTVSALATLEYSETPYDGASKEPTVAIEGLTQDVDYTVAYEDNIDAGTASVVIAGMGGYYGSFKKTFKILPIKMTGITANAYSGVYDKMGHTFTLSGVPAGANVTYSETEDGYYSSAKPTRVEVGETIVYYKVSLKNYEDFYGSTKITVLPISMEGRTVNLSQYSFTYDGKAKTPAVTITDLVAGTDYTVSYTDNVNAGKAKAVVTGKGNYGGTIVKEFTIIPASIAGKTVTLSQVSYTYDGTAKTPTVSVAGLKQNVDYTVAYANNVKVGTATVIVTGKGNYTGGITKTFEIKEKPAPAKNTTLTDAKTGIKYKVTKAGKSGGTVEFRAPKNKKVTKVTIPATVEMDGITYKVTTIAKSAFSGCSKLKTITIGKNVTTIGDKAFYNCKALTKITIPSKVTKIGKAAFYGCKKLKNITIKTTKLKSSTVGKNAFKGTPKSAVVKVPKKSLKAYKKFLYKKGLHKKAKITK